MHLIFNEININVCSVCESVKRHVESCTFLTQQCSLEDDFMPLNERISVPDVLGA